MAEEAYTNDLLTGWSQRAMVLLGNANVGINAERRSVLMKINPKLGVLAEKETSENPKGLLLGEDMIITQSKQVATFSTLDKVQDNMLRVFNVSVFGQASRRGLSVGCGFHKSRSSYYRIPRSSYRGGSSSNFNPQRESKLVEEDLEHEDKPQLDFRIEVAGTCLEAEYVEWAPGNRGLGPGIRAHAPQVTQNGRYSAAMHTTGACTHAIIATTTKLLTKNWCLIPQLTKEVHTTCRLRPGDQEETLPFPQAVW
ncbi:hypothetical protein NDU88_009095 [Pleurodeles waltl]|uniref:Uncharacterized protein n=1 Tax=Pleurodeles waltl TaxID=8319 RepID=A0AAV7PTZ5_PLEWA|nr:hypothetical protein NDU88_009095 [Pleurodeles waltl]